MCLNSIEDKSEALTLTQRSPGQVKCDEGKPSCRTCALRRETCVYLSIKSASPGMTRLPPSPSTSASSPARSPSPSTSEMIVYNSSNQADQSDSQLQLLQQPVFVPLNRDLDDMKLLWAYNSSTYMSFVTNIETVNTVKHAARTKLVEHALSTPFLMDCLLALTSMHMELTGTQELTVHRTKAMLYRARAFESYRKAIETADPATLPALAACSLILCAVSAQMFLSDDADIRRLYILNWIVVWRGISLVRNLIPPSLLENSGLYALFTRPDVDLDPSAVHIPSNLLFMVTSIKMGEVDFPEVEIYYRTLQYLGSLYRELKEKGLNPVLDLRIITFYTSVPSRFVDLARERRPRALVVVAHHLAMLKLVRSIWWTVGICEPQIQDIWELLGPEWDALLSVPRTASKLKEPEDMAKMLLDNTTWEPSLDDGIYQTTTDPQELWTTVWK